MGITRWLYLYIMVIALGGCASSRPNLVDQGILSLETIHTDKVLISFVDVDWDGESLEVSGRMLRRRRTLPVSFAGHADITIIAPDGKSFTRVGTHYHPRRIPRRRGAFFKISIPIDLRPGTIVRIEHHNTREIRPEEHGTSRGSRFIEPPRDYRGAVVWTTSSTRRFHHHPIA